MRSLSTDYMTNSPPASDMKKSDVIKYHLLRGLVKSLAVLPLGILYGLSDFAAFLLHRVIKYRVGIVRGNLRAVFPEKSDRELRDIENRFYRHLCDVFVEAAKLAHISDAEVARRIEFIGVDLVNDALARGQSVVLMLGHYGNWEWVTSSATQFIPGTLSSEIYHPLRDKAMDRFMLELRSRFGTENIPMSRAVRRLLQVNREGRCFVCGFISDQRPFTPELKHWTDFLGLDTAYVNGGEAIGTKIGAEMLYVEMLPLRRGHYRMTFSKLQPLDDGMENPYTRSFLRELENSIRRNPSYWLWSHNRWKRKRTPPAPAKQDTGLSETGAGMSAM